LLRKTGQTDLLALSITVLLDILLGTLEDDAALLLLGLALLDEFGRPLLSGLLLALALFQKSLGDEDMVVGWDAPVSH